MFGRTDNQTLHNTDTKAVKTIVLIVKVCPRFFAHVAVLGLAAMLPACGDSTSIPQVVTGTCTRDRSCSVGMECLRGSCVTSRPTLYPHIQLASPMVREYLDPSEVTWRASHADLIMARAVAWADDMRATNPNVRIFEYIMSLYYIYESEGEPWARAHGYDPEDFYLHYHEDVFVPRYGGTVLVPGFPPGVVPGWNPDWQSGDPPASATARWQARVPGITESSAGVRFIANMTHPGYRRFLADYTRRLLDGTLWNISLSTGPLDGVVVDRAIYYPRYDEGQLEKTNEFLGLPVDDSHPYPLAVEAFLPELSAELSSSFGAGFDVMPNYGHVAFLSLDDRFAQGVQQYVDWAHGEVWLMYRGGSTPTTGGTRVISYESDYENAIANIVRQTRAGHRRVVGAKDLSDGIVGSDRGRILSLALYYLIHNANTFYTYQSSAFDVGGVHISEWQWNPAVQYDIGLPARIPEGSVDFEGDSDTNEHYVLASGPDPYDPSLTYHLLARNFTGGIVLAKMLPAGSVIDDRSATRHQLDGPYAVLRGDGTLGNVISEVTIRNNEGLILIKK